MENISKALLIVGALLIGIILLGATVYLLRNAKGMGSEYQDTMSVQEVMQFNQDILYKLTFESNTKAYTATPQQLISIKNLIKEKEEKYKIKIENNIDTIVTLNGNDNETFLKENNSKYEVKIGYAENGRINSINFYQN